ncbi:gelsolin-like protein 1 isoform X2 [Montipora capricornis]|uniref:gelsolin-like protein 1 isoform X2 n=1 Tax=Montipora capricornis TaxID=246305 RepID=UPI0035F1E4F6
MEQTPYVWQDEEIKLFPENPEITGLWKERFRHVEDSGRQAWKVTEEGEVVEWELAAKGKFFSDEVYIILNCAKNTTISYDIHCWVGKQAPKELYEKGLHNAMALDEAMDGTPLVHREVQDFESKRFTGYFEDFTVLKGGSEESVNCNLHSQYKTRLLRITGPFGRNICVRETALKRGALDSNDVMIVDNGTRIYRWIGKGVNKNDKKALRVLEYANNLVIERRGLGIKVETVDDNKPESKNHPMLDLFPNQAKKRKPSVRETFAFWGTKKKMMFTVVSRMDMLKHKGDAYPQMKFEEMLTFRREAEGPDVSIRRMKSNEVSVVDIRFGKRDSDDHLFIRIGEDWKGDHGIGLIIGHYYLKFCPDEDKHPCIPITVVKEGQLSTQLNAAIGS